MQINWNIMPRSFEFVITHINIISVTHHVSALPLLVYSLLFSKDHLLT